MKRVFPFLSAVLAAALFAQLSTGAKTRDQDDYRRYSEWSIDGVRPGMSATEAKSKWGELELTNCVNFFGTKISLFHRAESSGYIVTDNQARVIQVEGLEFEKNGETLPSSPITAVDNPTVIENRCRATDIRAHQYKILVQGHPVMFRGPVAPRAVLGEDPEWMALCYRTDDLGICLEGLEHVSSLIPDAKSRLGRYAVSLDELPEYRKDLGLIGALNCPLGGEYRLNEANLTCFSHPEGPISVTRIGKNVRFWYGTPE